MAVCAEVRRSMGVTGECEAGPMAAPLQALCLLLDFAEFRSLLEIDDEPSWEALELRVHRLTLSQVEACIADVRRRAIRARDELVEGNLRLVAWAARRYLPSGLELDDLIQEGAMGLLKAIEKFDPSLGYTFGTYATHWIRQAIGRALDDQGRIIRIPVHMLGTLRKLERAEERLEAGEEDLEAPEAKAAAELRSKGLALDDALSVGDPLGAIPDLYLESARNATIASVEPFERSGLEALVQNVLSTLTPRERKVIDLRFGLNDAEEHTLEEVGHKFGLTRERIRQIEAKALRKLRHPSRSKKLRGYVDEPRPPLETRAEDRETKSLTAGA